MSERIARLRESLAEPLLVTNPKNVFYLLGLDSSNAALLVEPDRLRLFTDFRYLEKARAIDGLEVVRTRRDVYGSLPEHLSGPVAFEAAHVTYAHYQTLAAGAAELIPRVGVVEALRAVKDDRELGAIRRAAAIADEAFVRLLEEQWIGRTERELVARLEVLMREAGAHGLAFDTVVAAGPTGAHPHADPGERRVEPGQTVVVDWGAVVDGYCSDCTRTVSTGSLPDELARAYDVCRDAQQRAVDAVRAGMGGAEADAVARDAIAEAGFGEEFGHGLGHGVGLDVHEAPGLRPESSDTLVAGNVVTIEPGIYLPGRGGIRIEDLAIVTDGGVDVLTSVGKDLVTVV